MAPDSAATPDTAAPREPAAAAQEPPAAGDEAPGDGAADASSESAAPEARSQPRPAVRPAGGEPSSPLTVRRPSAEVVQAIRWLLSSDKDARARGVTKLRLLGSAVAPELRHWIRQAHLRTSYVEAVLAEIEGQGLSGVRRGRAVDAYLAARVVEARALAREGKHRVAQRLAEAILTLDPDGPSAWEVRRFVRDCRVRIAARELLEPSFEVSRRVYEVGESPVLIFRLHNHQRRTVDIQLERGVLGEATVSVRRQGVSGSGTREETRVVVRADGEPPVLTLGPGREWECTVPLDFGAPMPLQGVVARVVIEGRFRPTRWVVDDGDDNPQNANLTLRIPATELWIVPPGQLTLGDRPLEKMTAALLFGKDEAFFVGGQLSVWAGEEDEIYNGKVVETLIAHIAGLEGARLEVAGRLLAQATGIHHGADAAKWIEWWAKFRGDGGDGAPAN